VRWRELILAAQVREQKAGAIMGPMDAPLASFVAQSRMKLPGKAYTPCYRVIQ